ncbi:MAG: hypothetical protein KGI38_07200 [Thaumarchaeota archaeon]|nr:hypothetical protein [Nitrososphaerota archaeon]
MALPSDYTIVGTVLALAVAILLLSGLALYVAFRVRETLRDERGGGARAAKVAFLIGLLFLSGGVFYFFASGFNAGGTTSSILTTSTTTTSNSGAATSSTSSTSSPSTTASSTSITSTSSTMSATSAADVSMSVNCPSSASIGSSFSCTVTIDNTGSSTFQSATLTSEGDFSQFTVTGCTETVNGYPSTCTVVSATQVSAGNLGPGLTYLTLSATPPSTAGQKNCGLGLSAVGLPAITYSFTMQVNH